MTLFRLLSDALRDADRAVGKATLALERAEAKHSEAGANVAAVREEIESARLAALAAAMSGKEIPDYTALQLALERAVNRERAYAIAAERAREGLAAARQLQLALRASHARGLLVSKIAELRRLLAELRRLSKEIAQLGGSAEPHLSGLSATDDIRVLEPAADGSTIAPTPPIECDAAQRYERSQDQ